MKKKFFKKDWKIKKSKTPKNAKKLVKAKKAARRIRATVSKELAEVEPGTHNVTVESVTIDKNTASVHLVPSIDVPFIAEPETLADAAQDAQEPTPDVEVTA